MKKKVCQNRIIRWYIKYIITTLIFIIIYTLCKTQDYVAKTNIEKYWVALNSFISHCNHSHSEWLTNWLTDYENISCVSTVYVYKFCHMSWKDRPYIDNTISSSVNQWVPGLGGLVYSWSNLTCPQRSRGDHPRSLTELDNTSSRPHTPTQVTWLVTPTHVTWLVITVIINKRGDLMR